MKHFTRIEDFQNGVLENGQRMQFLQDLKTDSSLAREYELSQAIDTAISDQKTRDFESALGVAKRAFEKKRSFSLIMKVAAAITVLGIIGGSTLLDLNNRPSGIAKIADSYYEVYQPLNGMRGADPLESAYRKQAFDAYKKGDYATAISNFEKIAIADPTNVQARFYQACAFLETGASDKAVTLFTTIITSRDNFYSPLADYYLGMAYLKSGKKDLAIQQFEKVSNHQGGYQVKAGKILNALKSL